MWRRPDGDAYQVPSSQNRYPPMTPKTLRADNDPHVATTCSKGGASRSLHQGQNKKRSSFLNFSIASRDDATRTHDPYVPNVVR